VHRQKYSSNYIFNSSKLTSALSAPPLTLTTLSRERRCITRKEKYNLLAFGTLCSLTTEKMNKNSADQARPREAHIPLASDTSFRREAMEPPSQLEQLVSNTCLCDSLNLPQETKRSTQEKKRDNLNSIDTPQNALPQ
jgi:hypothetical protein